MAMLREGTNKIWGPFFLVYILGFLGLDIYWLFSESGPSRDRTGAGAQSADRDRER
jgi:hypothetical protein